MSWSTRGNTVKQTGRDESCHKNCEEKQIVTRAKKSIIKFRASGFLSFSSSSIKEIENHFCLHTESSLTSSLMVT